MDKNEINYHLSLHILKQWLQEGLITKEEFQVIDQENRRAFKPLIYAGFSDNKT